MVYTTKSTYLLNFKELFYFFKRQKDILGKGALDEKVNICHNHIGYAYWK